MSSHSVADGATRGIQMVVRLYPWSVLWVLLAVASVLIVQGSWVTIGLVSLMVLLITWHSIRRDHANHRERR